VLWSTAVFTGTRFINLCENIYFLKKATSVRASALLLKKVYNDFVSASGSRWYILC